MNGKITIEEKLAADKFHVDEKYAHIEVNKNASPEDIMALVRACPAGLYKYEHGILNFDYAGCFECGACRILSLGKVVEKWTYPSGGMGIEYRYG
jgi:ferredoxin-like protein FixX